MATRVDEFEPESDVIKRVVADVVLPILRAWEETLGEPFTASDAKARVSLPKGFANAIVIIEQVSDTELRIRKTRPVPEDELRFYEESARPLTNREGDRFLALLDNPPAGNAALQQAAVEYTRRQRAAKKGRHA